MVFVTKEDEDWRSFTQYFISKKQDLKLGTRNKPLDIEYFSRVCENAIRQILCSNESRILKHKLKTSQKHGCYQFNEFDYHLTDKKILGEVKVTYKKSGSLKRAQKQHQKIKNVLDSNGYFVQYILIDASSKEDTGLFIPEKTNKVLISGYSIFLYCLENGLINDSDFYQNMQTSDFANIQKIKDR